MVKRVKTRIAVQSEQRWLLSWWKGISWGSEEDKRRPALTALHWPAQGCEQLPLSPSPERLSEHLPPGGPEQGPKGSSNSVHIKCCCQKNCCVLPLGWEQRAQSHCLYLCIKLRSSLHLLCQELFWHCFSSLAVLEYFKSASPSYYTKKAKAKFAKNSKLKWTTSLKSKQRSSADCGSPLQESNLALSKV